jgi:hypothetical protein
VGIARISAFRGNAQRLGKDKTPSVSSIERSFEAAVDAEVTCGADSLEIEVTSRDFHTARLHIRISGKFERTPSSRDKCRRSEIVDQHANIFLFQQIVNVADAGVANDGQAGR